MSNRRKDDDSTVLFTNVHEVITAPDDELADRPGALLVIGGDLNGTIFNLFDGITLVGRGVDTSITLDFKGISRHHFQLMVHEDQVLLEDLTSRNGTFVNNRKIEGKIELRAQDVIKVGPIALKYLPKGDPERLAFDKLNRQANTDSLTGCFNRNFLNKAAELELKKSKLTGTPLSFILFDFDFFKKVNDEFGHPAGDYVLQEGSKLVRKSGIRDQDIFARVGGEEFAILLPRTNIKQGHEIAERIRSIIADQTFNFEQKKLPITISLGVADYRQGVLSFDDLYARADKALYQSKERGRNQVNFYRSN